MTTCEIDIRVEVDKVEKITLLYYLGSKMMRDRECMQDIKIRVALAKILPSLRRKKH